MGCNASRNFGSHNCMHECFHDNSDLLKESLISTLKQLYDESIDNIIPIVMDYLPSKFLIAQMEGRAHHYDVYNYVAATQMYTERIQPCSEWINKVYGTRLPEINVVLVGNDISGRAELSPLLLAGQSENRPLNINQQQHFIKITEWDTTTQNINNVRIQIENGNIFIMCFKMYTSGKCFDDLNSKRNDIINVKKKLKDDKFGMILCANKSCKAAISISGYRTDEAVLINTMYQWNTPLVYISINPDVNITLLKQLLLYNYWVSWTAECVNKAWAVEPLNIKEINEEYSNQNSKQTNSETQTQTQTLTNSNYTPSEGMRIVITNIDSVELD